MNREVHVRFWESPEVKVLRATRHSHRFRHECAVSGYSLKAAVTPDVARVLRRAKGCIEAGFVQVRLRLFFGPSQAIPHIINEYDSGASGSETNESRYTPRLGGPPCSPNPYHRSFHQHPRSM